jgi:MFS family permease
MMYTVPLYFRATQSQSNTEAGAHLFPAVIGNTIGGLLSGYVIQRTGRYKVLTIFASLSACLSYGLLVLRWHGHTSWLESLDIVPGGFGTGMTSSAAFIALTSSVAKSEIAMSTGGMYLFGSVGMVVGVAASSAIQLSALKVLLVARLHGPNAAAVSF